MISNLVSCLMITRNRGRFLPLSIGSFLRQDYRDVELIIVDDSEYPSWDWWLSGISKRDSFKYVYLPPGLGGPYSLGYKWNIAARVAQGEYQCYWADDDWHSPFRISTQVRLLKNHFDEGFRSCSLAQVHYYDTRKNLPRSLPRKFIVHEPRGLDGTMLWHHTFWEMRPFSEIDGSPGEGFRERKPEDLLLVNDMSDQYIEEQLYRCRQIDDILYIGICHGGNRWRGITDRSGPICTQSNYELPEDLSIFLRSASEEEP